jgi:cell division protein FtsB
MHPESEWSRSVGGPGFALVIVALVVYLSFAGLQGEHGLFRLLEVREQEAGLRDEVVGLRIERAALVEKTDRLSTGRPDLDLLDERARKVLGLGRPDELIMRSARPAEMSSGNLGD